MAARTVANQEDLSSFLDRYGPPPLAPRPTRATARLAEAYGEGGRVLVGCDFGSTTAKAVVLSQARS